LRGGGTSRSSPSYVFDWQKVSVAVRRRTTFVCLSSQVRTPSLMLLLHMLYTCFLLSFYCGIKGSMYRVMKTFICRGCVIPVTSTGRTSRPQSRIFYGHTPTDTFFGWDPASRIFFRLIFGWGIRLILFWSLLLMAVLLRAGKTLVFWKKVLCFLDFSVRIRADTKFRPRKNILYIVLSVT